jgi:hypothetical protein
MRINMIKVLSVGLTLIALVACVFFFTGFAQADDHRKAKDWIERSERDRSSIFDRHKMKGVILKFAARSK